MHKSWFTRFLTTGLFVLIKLNALDVSMCVHCMCGRNQHSGSNVSDAYMHINAACMYIRHTHTLVWKHGAVCGSAHRRIIHRGHVAPFHKLVKLVAGSEYIHACIRPVCAASSHLDTHQTHIHTHTHTCHIACNTQLLIHVEAFMRLDVYTCLCVHVCWDEYFVNTSRAAIDAYIDSSALAHI